MLKNVKDGKRLMIEPDTIKLLRECDAGIKMGVASIDEVLEYVHHKTFQKLLSDCKKKHEELHMLIIQSTQMISINNIKNLKIPTTFMR